MFLVSDAQVHTIKCDLRQRRDGERTTHFLFGGLFGFFFCSFVFYLLGLGLVVPDWDFLVLDSCFSFWGIIIAILRDDIQYSIGENCLF